MSMLEKIAFDINTDFVSEKDKTLENLYDKKDWYKGWDKRGDCKDKKFSELSDEDIKDLIDLQIGDTSLSFEELVMVSDLKSWILERRAQDIASSWISDKEDTDEWVEGIKSGYDSVFFLVDFVLKIIAARPDQREDLPKLKNLEKLLDAWNANLTNEPKGIQYNWLESHYNDEGENVVASDGLKNAFYKYSVSYIGSEEEKTDGLNFTVKGEAPAGDRRRTMILKLKQEIKARKESLSVDWKKLLLEEDGLLKGGCNSVKDIIILWHEYGRARNNAEKEKEIRSFNRAADCAGMVPTLQKAALAYTKAGYSLTENGLEKFTDS